MQEGQLEVQAFPSSSLYRREEGEGNTRRNSPPFPYNRLEVGVVWDLLQTELRCNRVKWLLGTHTLVILQEEDDSLE